MSDLQKLINKRITVPETKTQHFGPTLAQKKKGLKKEPNYFIMKRPSPAVGAKGTHKKNPES